MQAQTRVIMRIVFAADGNYTEFDGKYLQEYDPSKNGVSPSGRPMLAVIKCTDDISKAYVFEDVLAALTCYQQVSTLTPVRPDGMPNKPLTYFTMELVPLVPLD